MLDAFLQSLGRSAWVGAAIAHRNWLKAGLTEPTKGVLAVLSVRLEPYERHFHAEMKLSTRPVNVRFLGWPPEGQHPHFFFKLLIFIGKRMVGAARLELATR